MYENKKQPLIDIAAFRKRLLKHMLIAFSLVVITLGIGIAGHMYFDDMTIGEALVASITLSSGLGLSILPETLSGQLFVSLFGIFSGYIYLITSSIIIAPVLHRMLHRFHLDEC